MRRITLLVGGLVVCVSAVLTACSGGGSKSTKSPLSSSSSSTSGTTTTTLDPAAQSSLDHDGAIAFATLIGANLRRGDPNISQDQVDCLAQALVTGLGAHHFLELSNENFPSWDQADRDAAVAAFRGCGWSDDLLRRIGLLE